MGGSGLILLTHPFAIVIMSPIGRSFKDSSGSYGQPKPKPAMISKPKQEILYEIVDHQLFLTLPDTGRVIRIKKEHATAFAHFILGHI